MVKSGRVQFHRRVSSGIRSDEPDGDAEQYDSECSHSDIQRDTYGRGHLFERGIHGERGGEPCSDNHLTERCDSVMQRGSLQLYAYRHYTYGYDLRLVYTDYGIRHQRWSS